MDPKVLPVQLVPRVQLGQTQLSRDPLVQQDRMVQQDPLAPLAHPERVGA